MSRKVSILYSELADYSLSCFHALKKMGVSVQLIHWPINPEAPFQFDLSFLDDVKVRQGMSRSELISSVKAFAPDLILCSGWLDKDYLAVCRSMFTSSVTVLSLDNHWKGSLKQQLARLISPFTLKRSFKKAFVPGEVQKDYALRLGFHSVDVRTGFYCADVARFESYYHSLKATKKEGLPRRFLYLGRYVQHKGIFDLWEAFIKYKKGGGDWELWCVGTGDQYDKRIESEGIRHFGFVQPTALLPILESCGVYILPSHVEPWGVSVQEMAVAGFPMLLSDAIGAREQFLETGTNGEVFRSGDIDEICQRMQEITARSEKDLQLMSVSSHTLGTAHTPDRWAKILMSFL